MAKLHNLREDYQGDSLDETNLITDPFDQFEQWITKAIDDGIPEPNAMVLATVGLDGLPNARVVLLKGFDESGFVFYTNYESEKGQELGTNPKAALVFNWLEHQRQVRIRGSVEKVSKAITKEYFTSRPKGSQIGAWTSPQSQVIPDRSVLDKRQSELEERFAEAEELPVPDHWGGYRLSAVEIEFWQGRSSRLHDRYRFTKADGSWKIDRLAP